jgi:integrase/recombinase XerD
VAQLGARLDGIEEVVGSNPIGSTKRRNCSAYLLKTLTVANHCCQLSFFLLHSSMNLSSFRRNTDMAHHTLLARINSGDGKFPFVNVQFSKNHRPIPIENATYYLRRSSGEKRTPIPVGKDVCAAYTALIRIENGEQIEAPFSPFPGQRSEIPRPLQRKTLKDAAREYIERSKQKSRKTYLGYRTAVNLFVASCRRTYFDEICRDDMLDFLYELRTRSSGETGRPMGESTVFNYFLKTMVFLNDRGIGKYIAKEDWIQKKDWPINVDKRNKNKKYATYTDQEVARVLLVANEREEALVRFLAGTGLRIGEAAVTEWTDVNCQEKTVSVRFKPSFGFKPKDYEERAVAVSDTLLACLERYRASTLRNPLIFPSPVTGSIDRHLDRGILHLIDKARDAGYEVRRPRKPCHAFRVLYATRRHQHGVDIETLRQELGHSDISTTQIYLRSADKNSDKHRARINQADEFVLITSLNPSPTQARARIRIFPRSNGRPQTPEQLPAISRSFANLALSEKKIHGRTAKA